MALGSPACKNACQNAHDHVSSCIAAYCEEHPQDDACRDGLLDEIGGADAQTLKACTEDEQAEAEQFTRASCEEITASLRLAAALRSEGGLHPEGTGP